MTGLSEDERRQIDVAFDLFDNRAAHYAAVERIVTARVEAVQKVVERVRGAVASDSFFIPSQYDEDELIYADTIRVALGDIPT